MNKPYLKDPKVLQFEISSNCNANCIGCSRADPYDELKINPVIVKNQFLSLELFKRIVLADSFKHTEEIQFCGTIDDPPMHPDFLEMLEFVVKLNRHSIVIHTNGGMRKPEYWANMARVLAGSRYTLNFSIDGLAETNHIYRRGVQWDKLMDNVSAFIGAGGRAHWQWVMFPWNIHQLPEARELARDMGFFKFKERHDTCLDDRDLHELHERVEQEKMRANWNWDRYVHSMSDLSVHNGEIYCKTGNDELAYFIAHTGEIFPCCFLYNVRYQVINYLEHDLRYSNTYGANWNNANYHDVDDIVQHRFFQHDLVSSWNNRDHGRLEPTACNPICTNTCIKSKRGRWEVENRTVDLETQEIESSRNSYGVINSGL